MKTLRLIFRIIVAVPIWLFLQSLGTLAFTMFGIIPFLGLGSGLVYMVLYIGTGYKQYLSESLECFLMIVSIFGGSLVTWSWIKTGDFDLDNFGMTHIQNK